MTCIRRWWICSCRQQPTFTAVPAGVYNLGARPAGTATNVFARAAVSFVAGRVYTITGRGGMDSRFASPVAQADAQMMNLFRRLTLLASAPTQYESAPTAPMRGTDSIRSASGRGCPAAARPSSGSRPRSPSRPRATMADTS